MPSVFMSGAEPEAESSEIEPLGLDGQPLDVIESLATQLAQADCLEALLALLATCKALRALVVSSQGAWDALSRLRHSFERQPSVDVTAGFPGHDGAYVYTRGAPDDEMQRALIGSCVAWCVGFEGGHANFGRLEAARASILANLRVIECDISALPFKVGMLVLPSNEWLHNPGFGAMQAVYKQGGKELEGWVELFTESARERFLTSGAAYLPAHIQSSCGPLKSGDAVISPAFGSINADFLCHAVGVPFYDLSKFKKILDDGGEEAARATHDLQEQAGLQLKLIKTIFKEAAVRGVTSIAIPAISGGKRGFPSPLAAAITHSVAATEVLASRGTLEVHVVSWGAENHRDAFECAREEVARKLVPR